MFLELTGHAAERADDDGDDGVDDRRCRMTTATPRRRVAPRSTARHAVGDALTMAWRNLLNIRRNPQLLVFATIQPVIFVLMFRYVFGGAIQGSLPAGQTLRRLPDAGRSSCRRSCSARSPPASGSPTTCSKGLIDRFRSLPMARSAVLVGRTLADLVRNVFVVILMCVVGFIVGWTIGTNVFGLLGAIAIILAFAYSLSWVFAIVGLIGEGRGDRAGGVVPDPRAAGVRVVGVRAGGHDAGVAAGLGQEPAGVGGGERGARRSPSGGPTSEYVIKAIIWIVGIIAVCAPLAVARYRRAV